MNLKSTHTVAELHLSPAAYAEIASKLRDAGYDHCFGIGNDEGLIDMSGIGVRAEESEASSGQPIERQRATVAVSVEAYNEITTALHAAHLQPGGPDFKQTFGVYGLSVEIDGVELLSKEHIGGSVSPREYLVGASGPELTLPKVHHSADDVCDRLDRLRGDVTRTMIGLIDDLKAHYHRGGDVPANGGEHHAQGELTVFGERFTEGEVNAAFGVDEPRGSALPTEEFSMPGELLAFGRVRLENGQIVGDIDTSNVVAELTELRGLKKAADEICRLMRVKTGDEWPDPIGARLAVAVGKLHGELSELRELKKEVIGALDMCPLAIRVREGAGPEDLGKSIAVTVAKLEREIDRLGQESSNISPIDLIELTQRLPNARAVFIEEVKVLPRAELQRRALIQSDWIGAYARCLDGLDLQIDGKPINGSGIDGSRMKDDIRRIVERLLHMIGLKDELIEALTIEKERLYGLINSPQIANFLEAIKLEAVHQRERWGSDHDAGKTDVDWLFLVGFLGGKGCEAGKMADQLSAFRADDELANTHRERRLHHIVAAGAAVLNWHDARSGGENKMRPGIMPPAGEEA